MAAKTQQVALVAGDQEVGRPGDGDGEKEVVVSVPRRRDPRQIADQDGERAGR